MYGQYFVLFAIMSAGFILRKINLIDGDMNRGLNNFILFFSFPCLIIKNIGTLEMTGHVFTMFMQMMIMTFVVFFGGTFIPRLYYRLRGYSEKDRPTFEFASTMPNNGFLGFPIALLIYGQEGLLMMLATIFAFNVYAYGYAQNGYHRFDNDRTGGSSVGQILLKLIKNPNIIGLFIGFALSFFEISMPDPIFTFLDYMGGIATPMSMIYIGSSLAGTKFSVMVRDPKIWEGTFAKLIAMPALTLAFVWFLPLFPMVKMGLVLTMAFPVAALVPMLADMEKKDSTYGVMLLFLSTLLSMGTLLLWIWIINHTVL
ncbi:MAG: AEC family transporter [Anaerovoracaceae bacterium]|nr:AEC family transporter [Anaerovoracaceae bacterium]